MQSFPREVPVPYTLEYIAEAVQILRQLDHTTIERALDLLVDVRAAGGRVFFLGVGGGAGHASHAVNDFRKIAGIECYAPTDNVSELVDAGGRALGNDDGIKCMPRRIDPEQAVIDSRLLEDGESQDAIGTRTPFNQDSDWVFASPHTKGRRPVWPAQLLKAHIQPTAVKAGFPKIGWHSFRHTVSAWGKEAGLELEEVKTLLWHENISTASQIYGEMEVEAKRRIQQKLIGYVTDQAKADGWDSNQKRLTRILPSA
jgi:hypothetical protein